MTKANENASRKKMKESNLDRKSPKSIPHLKKHIQGKSLTAKLPNCTEIKNTYSIRTPTVKPRISKKQSQKKCHIKNVIEKKNVSKLYSIHESKEQRKCSANRSNKDYSRAYTPRFLPSHLQVIRFLQNE